MAPGRLMTPNGEDPALQDQTQLGGVLQALSQQADLDAIMLNGDASLPSGQVSDDEAPQLNGHIPNGAPQVDGHVSNGELHLNGNGVNGEAHMNGHSTNGTNGTNGHAANGHALNGDTPRTESPVPESPNPLKESFGNENKPNAGMPIAVIGIAVRAGAASTPDEFFEMLSRGRSSFSPQMPPERFNNASFYHPNAGKLGCINANGSHFIQQDVTKFDAPFFSITELEATSMDPQQRLLLECAFEALDNAGIQKHATVGKDIGVFMGAGSPEYEFDLFRDSDTMPMFQATGTPPGRSPSPHAC